MNINIKISKTMTQFVCLFVCLFFYYALQPQLIGKFMSGWSVFLTTLFQIKINRIHHGCPVEIGKSQPEGPPVPVGNEARRVSHWNGGPEGWDFPFSTEHP